jgi:G3E family GTPase
MSANDAANGGPDARGPLRPLPDAGSLPVSLISAIDPVLRDVLVTSLLLERPGMLALRYEVDAEHGALRRVLGDAERVIDDSLVELDHPCVSCAMREDAIPLLARLAAQSRWNGLLLAPPISADPEVVVRTILPGRQGWHLGSSAAVVDMRTAVHDLLEDDTLAERGLQWADGDERAVGEALAAQVEYADVLVLDGADGAARELIEHLRAPEQQVSASMHTLHPKTLLLGRHSRARAEARRDPRRVEPYGGPTAHGTWTLDLSSERPFHPERLLERIEELGAGRLRGRGRFWVPDRPGTICQWDGAGGQVSIGAIADAGRELPTTRLVVTGIGAADAERVRRAFGRILLTPEEWADGLAPWLGAEDRLAPWLGEREAAA